MAKGRWRFATPKILVNLAGLIVLGAGFANTEPRVKLEWNESGLSTLRFNGIDYLGFGDFRLMQVIFEGRQGPAFAGDLEATTSVDLRTHVLTRKSSWGSIVVQYVAVGNRLNIRVTVNNRSQATLQGIWFEPLGFRFSSPVEEYDGNTPLLANSNDQLALVGLRYQTGTLALASEDGARPVQIGFPWALDRPKSTVFPISVNTGRVNSFPDSCPTIRRPIAPGESDSFSFSVRFGSVGATTASLVADIHRKFAADFPPSLAWTDRRPIGALFLSTADAGWPENPRGWLQDPELKTDTDSGVADFKKRVLAYADTSIAILKKMNAQGMITWDIEGQQYPHAASYIGDPRIFETLAPEMAGVADEYFQRFRDAGLRVGICIRSQQITIATDRRSIAQNPVADPTDLLIYKALYARKRWGATLFYVDSNVNADDLNPIPASTFQRLSRALPEALFIPEHSQLKYYAYTAPYRELRQGHASTDARVRAVYPGAFSVVYTADGPIDRYHDELVDAVRHGDILLFRGWFGDDQNNKDSQIYYEAQHPNADAHSAQTP